MNILDFFTVRYKDGARGEGGYYDCWALARSVRHEVYGKPLLHEYAGASRFTPVAFAKAANAQVSELSEIKSPVAGAIVGVYRRGVCHHVAVAVQNETRIDIMDINPSTGVRLCTVAQFKKRFYGNEVKFYD